MTDRYIVTTSVTDPATGKAGAPVSLDSPGVTRDKDDARRLRNEYVLTIGAAGTIGAPARIYTSPDADVEGWVVEYLSTRGKLVTRETVTFVRAEDHPPYVRHIERGGRSLTTDDVLRDTFNISPHPTGSPPDRSPFPMQFILTIECDNDAFVDYPGQEVADVLTRLADRVRTADPGGRDQSDPFVLRDINGNRVGTAYFTEV